MAKAKEQRVVRETIWDPMTKVQTSLQNKLKK